MVNRLRDSSTVPLGEDSVGSIPIGSKGIGIDAPSRKFFKENYIKAVEIITPKHYFEDVEYLSNGDVRATEKLINSHLFVANSINSVLPISSVAAGYFTKDVSAFEGITKYFIKQNNFLYITPNEVKTKILEPLGKSFNDFKTKEDFKVYLSGTLFPTIVCIGGGGTTLPSALGATVSAAHNNLAGDLNWLYFLNRADQVGTMPNGYSTSGAVIDLIAERMSDNKPIVLADSLKILQTYLWYNYPNNSYSKPYGYTSGVGEFVSGSQQLDNVKTLVDIVYSQDYFNANDDKVAVAFSRFDKATSLFKDKVNDSSFYRFWEAISFYFADVNNVASELQTLLSIEECPDEFLPYLAELIGWELIGYEHSRWRAQLRNAIETYKHKGTKKGIQILLDTYFGANYATFNADSIVDLWESYLPNIILYSLVTESSLFFKENRPLLQQRLLDFRVDGYSETNMETNARFCVDKILLDLAIELPKNFSLENSPFPKPKFFLSSTEVSSFQGIWEGAWHLEQGVYYTGEHHSAESQLLNLVNDPNKLFKYRGRTTSLPPFEDERYYLYCLLNENLITTLSAKLKCFGVNPSFILNVESFLRSRVVDQTNINYSGKGFLLFTSGEVFPPNYDSIVSGINSGYQDPVDYISLWNGKSSYLKGTFPTSAFKFSQESYGVSSSVAAANIFKIINRLLPSHAIPDFIIHDTTTDVASSVNAYTYPEMGIEFPSYTFGSGVLTNNYMVSSWSMSSAGNAFIRSDSDNLSSTLSIFSGALVLSERNTFRRRDLRHLLPKGGYCNRDGINMRGYLPLSGDMVTTAGQFSSILGYVGSAMAFNPVVLVAVSAPFGPSINLLSSGALSSVWGQCENYNSTRSFFGVNVSSTYPNRGKLAGNSASAMAYTTRGDLSDVMALQHRVLYYEKILNAYSLLSAHYISGTGAMVNSSAVFPTSANISPSSVSSWIGYGGYNSVLSLANYLEEKTISDNSTGIYDNFMFGGYIHRFYNDYKTMYDGGLSSLQINSGKGLAFFPNVITHTFGPYIYNSDFYHIGIGGVVSGKKIISKTEAEEFDICYGGGSGILSPNGAAYYTSAVSGAGDLYVQRPEFYNKHIVDGISLIDTSGTIGSPMQYRVFSVFNFPPSATLDSDNSVPVWARNDVFVDNLALKYSRPSAQFFPRVRLTINPSPDDTDTQFSNFLVPEHKYKLKVTCANMGTEGGNTTLGAWIHTNIGETYAENDAIDSEMVGSYKGGKWVISDPANIRDNNGGIDTVINDLSIEAYFQGTNPPQLGGVTYQNNCLNYYNDGIYGNPSPQTQGLAKLTKDQFEIKEFEFDTINAEGDSRFVYSKLHRLDTVYHIDIFIKNADPDKYIVIDSISLEDITNQERSVIGTKYGNYNLNRKDLRTVFKYFKGLSSGLASRDAIITSGTLGVSGGARASYRTANALYNAYASPVTANSQVSSITITE